MAKTLHSARQRKVSLFLTERRKALGLTQVQVARSLGRHQPFVANLESGDRRVDIVELLDIASVLHFDPRELIDELEKS